MVPLSASRLLFADLAERISRDLDARPFDPLTTALRVWLRDKRIGEPESTKCLAASLDGARSKRGYRDVAALAFLAARGQLGSNELSVLGEGLRWVSSRPPLSPIGEYQSFANDPVALLGLAAGAATYAGEGTETMEWLRSFLPDVVRQGRHAEWKRVLYAGCLETLDLPRGSISLEGAADVTVALRSVGLFKSVSPSQAETLSGEALNRLGEVAGTNAQDLARSALALAAYDGLMAGAPVLALGQPTIEQIVDLLKRIGSGLRRWPFEPSPRTSGSRRAEWHVDNEYHVQSLLYVVLSPYLPGLREEENLPSVGQKNPRADLAYLPLRLLIEVKFMRASASFSDMIGEIAQDTGLYLTPESQYDAIAVFVWDDLGRHQEHPLFLDGLSKLRGVVGGAVVSRPSHMGLSYSVQRKDAAKEGPIAGDAQL